MHPRLSIDFTYAPPEHPFRPRGVLAAFLDGAEGFKQTIDVPRSKVFNHRSERAHTIAASAFAASVCADESFHRLVIHQLVLNLQRRSVGLPIDPRTRNQRTRINCSQETLVRFLKIFDLQLLHR